MGHYLPAGAGAAGVFAAGVFTVFLTAFLWCFLAEAAGLVAPLAAPLVAPLAAGAGVCAADIRDRLASARAMVNTVVFIFFFSCGLAARSQSHLAAWRLETR